MNCFTRKTNCFTCKTLVGANRVRMHLLHVKPYVLYAYDKNTIMLMYCFTRKINWFTRKDKCFTRKTLDK